MKPRIFSLMMVLTIILFVPPAMQSCVQHVDAAALQQTTDDVQVKVNADSVTVDVPESSPVSSITGDLFGWQNILVMVLGVVAAFFGTKWKKAANVIKAIDDALQDGKIDKNEITRIVNAWKGNT